MTLLGDQVGQGDVCKSTIAERVADQEETFYGSVAFILSKDDYHEGTGLMFAWSEDPIVCSWVGCGEEPCGGTRRLSWPVVKLVNHHPRQPTSRHHPCDDPSKSS